MVLSSLREAGANAVEHQEPARIVFDREGEAARCAPGRDMDMWTIRLAAYRRPWTTFRYAHALTTVAAFYHTPPVREQD